MEWSESISEAINYIESHITEELTIADIAKQAIISPILFSKRVFDSLWNYGIRIYKK
mgnify:CR=1 FL=1